MARDEGFAIADISTAQLTDPKVRRLWRECAGNVNLMNAAMMLYHATVLESWQHGQPIAAENAAPFWMLELPLAPLKAAEMLTEEGFVPEHAWESWYGPAHKRRAERQESGRKGGLASGRRRKKPAQAEPKQSFTNGAGAVEAELNPSVLPSVRSASKEALRDSLEIGDGI